MSLCTDKLISALQTTDGLQEDVISGKVTIGDLATKAWGNELKASCYAEFGQPYKIYNFVAAADIQTAGTTPQQAPSTGTNKVQQLLSSLGLPSSVKLPDFQLPDFNAYLTPALWVLGVVTFLLVCGRLFKYLMAFIYDVLNA